MRILVSQILQESHSFTVIPGKIESFKNHLFLEGADIPRRLRNINNEISGSIDVIEREGVEPVYGLAAQSVTTGPLEAETFSYLLARLLWHIRSAGKIDGVYLALHGAMLTRKTDDATGGILHAVRELVGRSLPIVASLDLHANVTDLIVQNADALVGYHTFPHTDFRQVGQKATEILIKAVKREIQPTIGFCKISMLIPPEAAQTDREPASRLINHIREIEKEPDVVAAFYCAVQPWYDVPNVGCSVVVVTNGNRTKARERARELAEEFWSLRRDFEPRLYTVEEALLHAKDVKGLVVFLDSADGTSSGSAGDNTEILDAFLRADFSRPVFTTIVDAAAVSAAAKAGVGNMVSVALGGKIDKDFSGKPVQVNAEVLTVYDGLFRNEGEIACGMELNMGRTAVLKVRNVFVLVMEKATFLWDPAVYRSAGLKPEEASIVVVKSPVAAYRGIAEEMLFVDTMGASSPHIARMPFQNIRHPLYPFDDVKRIECG